MKILIIISVLFLTGCASTNINGVPPGENQAIKVIGTIVVAGVLAKAIAKPGANSCTSTIKNNIGQTVGTSTIVKQGPC